MADLEKLALKRDRGYVFRLVALLVIAVVIAAIQYGQLTGDRAGDCLADAYLGRDAKGAGSAAPQPEPPGE